LHSSSMYPMCLCPSEYQKTNSQTSSRSPHSKSRSSSCCLRMISTETRLPQSFRCQCHLIRSFCLYSSCSRNPPSYPCSGFQEPLWLGHHLPDLRSANKWFRGSEKSFAQHRHYQPNRPTCMPQVTSASCIALKKASTAELEIERRAWTRSWEREAGKDEGSEEG
jgi:hypothetical protein